MATSINSEEVNEDDDIVEKMIRKTGCLQYHYNVQNCMSEQQDWRKCQPTVKAFRQCMEEYEKTQRLRAKQ